MTNNQTIDPRLLTDENPTKCMVPRSTGRIDGFRFPGSKIIPIGWPRKIRWLDHDSSTFIPKDSFQATAHHLADRCILALYEEQQKVHLKLRMRGLPGLVLSYGDIVEKFKSKSLADLHNEFDEAGRHREIKMEICLYIIGLAAFEYSHSKWRPSHKHSAKRLLSYAESLWDKILETLKSKRHGGKGGRKPYKGKEPFKLAFREYRDLECGPPYQTSRPDIAKGLKQQEQFKHLSIETLIGWAEEADEEDGIIRKQGRKPTKLKRG